MGSRLDQIQHWESLATTTDFNLAALTHQTGVTGRHLRRYFRARFGLTPKQWLDHLRLNKARELLRSGCLVKQVAAECHFKQASHFSRVFKKYFGQTPRHVLRPRPRAESPKAASSAALL